jgi:NADH dehydrogenase
LLELPQKEENMPEIKNIVIVGGGYGGLTTVLGLAKSLKKNKINAKVTLIDKQNYHLCHPNIYEVATAEEEFTSNSGLRESVAIDFLKILPKEVEFIQGELQSIDQSQKNITVSNQKISFDYLVLALGSTSDDFGIPGVKEYTLTLKSLSDSLRIRNDLEFIFQMRSQDLNKKLIRIVIAGGGFSGVEFGGELLNFIDILSWKHKYPREKIELMIVEGAPQLLPGLDSEVSRRVYNRLDSMGTRILLSTMITKVEQSKVTLSTEEVLHYDILIWTGGVKSIDLPFAHPVDVDKKHRCAVDEYLSLQGSSQTIFLLGDNACIMDKEKRPLPQTAVQAIDQGKYLAYAIEEKINNQKIVPYPTREFGYMIPVRGKWVIFHTANGFVFSGYIPWLVRRFADFRYYRSLMPFRKALRMVWRDTRLYARNDN